VHRIANYVIFLSDRVKREQKSKGKKSKRNAACERLMAVDEVKKFNHDDR